MDARWNELQLFIKRAIDLTLCLVLLILVWPFLLLLALVVRLSSPGPVLFRQARLGKRERPFVMYKFRTMRVATNKEAILTWTEEEAARITRAGRFLRDYGLDELPQIWNILRGDMSIIGPRPPLPGQLASLTKEQRRMFEMRPGVLSIAVIEGRRSLPIEKRWDFHALYVERWSLWLDAKILLRSTVIVLTRRNSSDLLST